MILGNFTPNKSFEIPEQWIYWEGNNDSTQGGLMGPDGAEEVTAEREWFRILPEDLNGWHDKIGFVEGTDNHWADWSVSL